MSVQQSRLPIRKLPDPIIPADAAAPSPANPLAGRSLQSPKGWRNRESDGVGLGILAALEKGEAPAKIVVAAPSLSLSAPIVIGSRRATVHRDQESEVGCTGRSVRVAFHKVRNDEDSRCRELGFFCGSPARLDGDESPAFRTADFLSRCHLCSKRLHGKDIYMYRGEKAFCSMECRYRQIVSDEFQEKCWSEASKPSDVSSSPYSGGGRLFFTGIAAA